MPTETTTTWTNLEPGDHDVTLTKSEWNFSRAAGSYLVVTGADHRDHSAIAIVRETASRRTGLLGRLYRFTSTSPEVELNAARSDFIGRRFRVRVENRNGYANIVAILAVLPVRPAPTLEPGG